MLTYYGTLNIYIINNSIESLNLAKEPNPELTITFHFKGLLDSQKELEDIDITDNGEGFTEEVYRRFQDTFNCDMNRP